MDAVPASAWLQYPVALILLVVVFMMLREFIKFLKEQNKSWQDFLEKQNNTDQTVMRELASQVKNLAQELVNLRSDFDRAVAVMQERTSSRQNTRPRTSSK